MSDWHDEAFAECSRREALWGIDWPGHPSGGVNGPVEESLRHAPESWQCLRVENDPEADYSYDDLALMRRSDGLYALVRTSGCSCPSPTETWGVVASGSWSDCVANIDAERRSWGGDSWTDQYGSTRSGPYPAMDAWMRENDPGQTFGGVA